MRQLRVHRWLLFILVVIIMGVSFWWLRTPRLATPSPTPKVDGRRNHTATLLQDGTILVVGGTKVLSPPLASTERFDPQTGLWLDSGNLQGGRKNHTATLLRDGTVLVVGGTDTIFLGRVWGLKTVERYDPQTNRWRSVASLPVGRTQHIAALLPDGRVLVAGGAESDDVQGHPQSDAWVYDPQQDRWRAIAPLQRPRSQSGLVTLTNGNPLVIGGLSLYAPGEPYLPEAEYYDLQQQYWVLVRGLNIGLAGSLSVARLQDNQVVVVTSDHLLLADATGEHWHFGMPPPEPAIYGTLTALSTGQALLIVDQTQAQFDPATEQWQVQARQIERMYHTATLLPDGRVVVLGGQNPARVGPGHQAEIIQP